MESDKKGQSQRGSESLNSSFINISDQGRKILKGKNGYKMVDRVYVIGHVNPDTDSIAAAMGYAWLLRERDGMDTVAARAGAINPQTTWTLRRLELEPPFLLTDASPRFDAVSRRLDSITPDSLLRDAWVIASRTGGIAPVVSEEGKPVGLITGFSFFQYLSKLVGHLACHEKVGYQKSPNGKTDDRCANDIYKSSVLRLSAPMSQISDHNQPGNESDTNHCIQIF